MILVVLSAPPVNAADSVLPKKDELLCGQIQEKIRNKQEIRDVVISSIQTGQDACGVIKCAIKGGGDLQQVICGAVEAHTTKDVASKCSIDAGADSREVAAILNTISQTGLCSDMPVEPEIIDYPPPRGHPGGFLSPSHF